jgi:hypothetical protein
MKIPKRTIKITLEEEGQEPAIFTFGMLHCNESERILSALGAAKKAAEGQGDNVGITEAIADYREAILSKCIAVENLSFEDGAEITVDDVRGKRLPMDVIEKILAGYHAASAVRSGGEAEEKNVSSPSEPSPG